MSTENGLCVCAIPATAIDKRTLFGTPRHSAGLGRGTRGGGRSMPQEGWPFSSLMSDEHLGKCSSPAADNLALLDSCHSNTLR